MTWTPTPDDVENWGRKEPKRWQDCGGYEGSNVLRRCPAHGPTIWKRCIVAGCTETLEPVS